MGIVLVGTSHKTAPVEVRERLAFAESRLAGALRELVDREMISEGLIVSTCNRVELIAATPNGAGQAENAVSRLYDFLSRFHQHDLSPLRKHLYDLAGRAAIKHVFRVTSSLDSMVVGEPQITGQVKEAFQRAQDAAVVGHELTRLMNRAFAVAKRVRNETGVGSSAVSISFVAVELARKVFEDLKGSAVMLLGAGEMAELAAKHLLNYGASRLLIVNRTFENAVALAGELNGEPVPFDEFEKRLPEAEILICSTGAPDYLIRPDHVRRALERRRNRPVLLVDISVPRNIDPAIGRLDNASSSTSTTWRRSPRPTAPNASARRLAPRRSSKPRPNSSSAPWPKATSTPSSESSANKFTKWPFPSSSAAANASEI
jgi:glutamyl-tRNA reductase